MAKRRPNEPNQAQLTTEQIEAAIPKIERRIADLEQFDVSQITRRGDPLVSSLALKINETIKDIFGHGTLEYNSYYVSSFDTLPHQIVSYGRTTNYSLQAIQHAYKEGINRCALKLNTLHEIFKERIIDANIAPTSNQPTRQARRTGSEKSVFIVHGHNNDSKESVARFLEKLELKPVILHEQANEGRTIIEKFEAYSDVAFAVVLLTPDDVGYAVNNQNEASARARQNVIFELGFFTAALSRKHTCALYTKGVELPSDFSGVLYHELDPGGAWRMHLAKELKAAGLPVDMNLAVA
jgi:predicted nucleotide-binding protein